MKLGIDESNCEELVPGHSTDLMQRYPRLGNYASWEAWRSPLQLTTWYCQVCTQVCAMLYLLVAMPACSSAQPPTENISQQSGAEPESDDLASAVVALRKAEAAFAQKQYEQVLQSAKRAAQLAPESAGVQQRCGELLYLSGHAQESLKSFDRVVSLVPERAAENWQRGIALATVGRFEEAAEQFETHHTVNPDDVENSAWYFLCIAKTKDIAAARETVIPSRGDGREPMMSVLGMLKQKLQPQEVIEAAIANTRPGPYRERAKFYADLYVGLYFDALSKPSEAAEYLRRSLTYESGGYMVDTARVYLQKRFGDATNNNDTQEAGANESNADRDSPDGQPQDK